MVKMAGMCLLSSTATEESRVEALEVVLETVQVEEKPFRALLRKLCKPPMRAEDSTGWNNKEKSSNNPCTCPPPTYNSKNFFSTSAHTSWENESECVLLQGTGITC